MQHKLRYSKRWEEKVFGFFNQKECRTRFGRSKIFILSFSSQILDFNGSFFTILLCCRETKKKKKKFTFKGGNSTNVLELLNASASLNATQSIEGVTGTTHLLQSSAWSRYGNNDLSSLHSNIQLAFHYSETSPDDVAVGYCKLADQVLKLKGKKKKITKKKKEKKKKKRKEKKRKKTYLSRRRWIRRWWKNAPHVCLDWKYTGLLFKNSYIEYTKLKSPLFDAFFLFSYFLPLFFLKC